MKVSHEIRAAIASIEAQISQLEKAGIEKGSVQRYGPSGYRLAWREGETVKFSSKLDPSTVSWHRAAHRRWLQREELRKYKKRLLEALERRPNKRLLAVSDCLLTAS